VELETFSKDFRKKKYLNIWFRENMSYDSPFFPREQTDGWTDRHDKANSCFS